MPQVSTERRALTLLALCLAALILNIDVTIVNVALPSLVRELGTSTTQLQWVVDAYTLVFAALILAAGSLSDRLGRKGVLLVGLLVFALGSLAGSFADTPSKLIAARALMGVGAATIFPSTLSLIANVFSGRRERALALGVWGAMTGVGVATGPIVGGWLLGQFWWGSIFLFMVPLALAIAVLVAIAVPTSRDLSTPPVDWRGLLLSSAGMAVLVLGVIEAPNWGWTSPRALATLTSGLVVLSIFLYVESRLDRPMLDVQLFRNRRFSAASGAITIGFFSLTGFTFLITQYFQFVRSYSALATGVRLLPVAISIAVAAVAGTRLAMRTGNRVVVATGLLGFAASLLWIALIAPGMRHTGYGIIAAQMVLGGSGLGLISAPATEAILGAVPKHKAGVGSAMNDATRLFGATLGVAVVGSISASLYQSRLTSAVPHGLPVQATDTAKASLGGAIAVGHRLVRAGLPASGHHLADSATTAFLHAMKGGILVAGIVALAGAVLAALLLPARPADDDVAPDVYEPEPTLLAAVGAD